MCRLCNAPESERTVVAWVCVAQLRLDLHLYLGISEMMDVGFVPITLGKALCDWWSSVTVEPP